MVEYIKTSVCENYGERGRVSAGCSEKFDSGWLIGIWPIQVPGRQAGQWKAVERPLASLLDHPQAGG